MSSTKPNIKHLIFGLVLGIIITLTALVSLAFSVYPYAIVGFAPKIIIDILTVINFVLPVTGIIVMLTFIYRREHQ